MWRYSGIRPSDSQQVPEIFLRTHSVTVPYTSNTSGRQANCWRDPAHFDSLGTWWGLLCRWESWNNWRSAPAIGRRNRRRRTSPNGSKLTHSVWLPFENICLQKFRKYVRMHLCIYIYIQLLGQDKWILCLLYKHTLQFLSTFFLIRNHKLHKTK